MKLPQINISFILLLILSATFSSFNIQDSKIGDDVKQLMNYDPDEKILIWIYFNGKTNHDQLQTPEKFLTQRSIDRRHQRIRGEVKFDEKDLPVDNNYIEELKQAGIKIKHKSKWFNSVSCYADKNQIQICARKSFVTKIETVKRYKINYDKYLQTTPSSGHHQDFNMNEYDSPASINYGPSYNQSQMISIPQVHNMGFSGQGVLIASFDAGVDNLQHNCFDLIRSRGLRTWDFVNGDTIIANGPGRKGQGLHGTYTLSLIAGYDEGNLVSPAFSSDYIIAKTENTDEEIPSEEDNWLAAVEWADSLGADIITSSLGYRDYPPPYKGYTWQDMNGNTALITRAAKIAARKGIIVVSSAGNKGLNILHNTLEAPADADSIITVGASNMNGTRAGFSSVGPTFDGRIKPEVIALGVNNVTAKSGSGNLGYQNTTFGTSLSCPMVAGVCALILSAHPGLSPIEVRNILTSTADSSKTPSNYRGWGMVNAFLAVQKALNLTLAQDFQLEQNFPNPFNPSTTIRFSLKRNASISLNIYDVSGRLVRNLLDNVSYGGGNFSVNFINTSLSSGVYFYSMIANGNLIETKKMIIVK